MRDGDLLQPGAEPLEHAGGAPHRGGDVVTDVVEEVVDGDADSQAGDAAVEARGVVGDGRVERRRVERVGAGDGVQHQRAVAHVAGERADVVERPGERRDAALRRPAVGGLEPDGAAERGGDADRSAGVGADPDHARARGERRRRAAARAAGDAADVPRVAGGRGDRPVGELVGVGLPDHHHARREQVLDHDGVAVGDVALAHLRARRRRHTGGVAEVLDTEGDPVERAAVAAAGDLLLGAARSGAGEVGGDAREGVDRALGGVDAAEHGVDELHG